MEFIFELVFEVIFEIIFEGSLEIGTSRKVPVPVRILAALIFGLVTGGFLVMLLLIAVQIMKQNAVLGWLFVLLVLFLAGCAIYAVWKKIKTKRSSDAEQEE